MKKTSRINRLRTKVMAAMLAAVMMFSALTFNATKVSAATLPNPYDVAEGLVEVTEDVYEFIESVKSVGNRIPDKDIEKMKKIGIQTLTAAMGLFIPGGRVIAPIAQGILGSAFGSHEMSLEDINDNINGLYDVINNFENSMKAELGNVIPVQNFDYAIMTPLNSAISGMARAIKTAQDNPENTPKQMLAIIAAQIDADVEWKKISSVFVAFTSATSKINSGNILNGKDLFTTVYDHFKQRSMFSGEAIDQARVVLDNVMKNYMAAYTILMECLTAQLMVNALESKEGIDPYYLSHISTNVPEIMSKINELNACVVGTMKDGVLDITGTVQEKYNNILNMNRMILVNNGKGDAQLTGAIKTTNHNEFKNVSDDVGVGTFNSKVWSGSHLTGAQIRDMAAYAKGKGLTVRELLEKNGISTADIPKNTYLASSEAYNDFGAGDVVGCLIGYSDIHGFYKGVDIDEKNPSEKEVTMWKFGSNGIFKEAWNTYVAGNAATIGTF